MNALLSLVLLSLFAGPPLDLAAQHRFEVGLLHLPIRPGDLGANLKIWEPRQSEWLPTEASDPPSARVVVCYLFSPAAPATAAELGWLRQLAQRVESHHHDEVRFLFIASGASAAEMKILAASLPDKALKGALFLDASASLSETLRQQLPGATLPLPLTLLLDDQRTVRQSLLGPLAARRGELVSGISDLLHQLRERRPGAPATKEQRP